MNFSELFVGQVGVHLGGGNIGVAQQFLDRTQIGSVYQKVGGVAMPQHMGRYFFLYAGFAAVVVNQSLDGSGDNPADDFRIFRFG